MRVLLQHLNQAPVLLAAAGKNSSPLNSIDPEVGQRLSRIRLARVVLPDLLSSKTALHRPDLVASGGARLAAIPE